MNSKKVLDSLYYRFNPTTRAITFTNGLYLKQEDILLIVNLNGNKLIYNFACSTEGGSLVGNVLTLVYNTTAMSAADKLMIVIKDEDKKEETLIKILEELKELKESFYEQTKITEKNELFLNSLEKLITTNQIIAESTIEANASQLDDTSTVNVTYVGTAQPGSSTKSAVWRIKKIDETTGTIVTWANGNDKFEHIWDNRVNLTYL